MKGIKFYLIRVKIEGKTLVWLSSINRKDLTPPIGSRICHEHSLEVKKEM